MDRHSRRLSHKKGNRMSMLTKAPISSDGDDGDMAMVNTVLHIKTQGRWIPFAPAERQDYDWHGFKNIVKIDSFNWKAPDGKDIMNYSLLSDNGASISERHNSSTGAIEAAGHNNSMIQNVFIPAGATAVSAIVYGENISVQNTTAYVVYEYSLDGTGGAGQLKTGAAINTTNYFASRISTATKSNVLTVLVAGLDQGEEVYGGFIEIKVPSSPIEGVDTGLPRSS